jgi:hypothetical protein
MRVVPARSAIYDVSPQISIHFDQVNTAGQAKSKLQGWEGHGDDSSTGNAS